MVTTYGIINIIKRSVLYINGFSTWLLVTSLTGLSSVDHLWLTFYLYLSRCFTNELLRIYKKIPVIIHSPRHDPRSLCPSSAQQKREYFECKMISLQCNIKFKKCDQDYFINSSIHFSLNLQRPSKTSNTSTNDNKTFCFF